MEDITRKELDGVCQVLETTNNQELAEKIRKADLIPKLYQYAYVESMFKILSKFDSIKDLDEKMKYGYSHEKYLLEKETPFNAVKGFLEKAHDRQNEICDFEDSPLPVNKTGRCDDEDHYENTDYDLSLLSKQDQEKFEEIHDNEGWNEAHDQFIDVFNPNNQKLTLILNFNEDETKCIKDDGWYVCETCLEIVTENSEGSISCDIDMAEDN